MKFPHLGKFGWVLVIAVIVGGFQLINAYRVSQNPIIVRQVVPSVATVSPSTEAEIVVVDGIAATKEPDATLGFASFEADIKAENGVYWPFTNVQEYSPRLDRGLTILCYTEPDDPVRDYYAGYPNGMPTGIVCGYFRVAAYRYSPEQLVAVSVMRPLPGPGEIP